MTHLNTASIAHVSCSAACGRFFNAAVQQRSVSRVDYDMPMQKSLLSGNSCMAHILCCYAMQRTQQRRIWPLLV